MKYRICIAMKNNWIGKFEKKFEILCNLCYNNNIIHNIVNNSIRSG